MVICTCSTGAGYVFSFASDIRSIRETFSIGCCCGWFAQATWQHCGHALVLKSGTVVFAKERLVTRKASFLTYPSRSKKYSFSSVVCPQYCKLI
jgi:hypothetical protein